MLVLALPYRTGVGLDEIMRARETRMALQAIIVAFVLHGQRRCGNLLSFDALAAKEHTAKKHAAGQ